MTAAYFTCLSCSLIGSDDRSAEKHTKATGHPTLTGTNPEVLATIRERVIGRAA